MIKTASVSEMKYNAQIVGTERLIIAASGLKKHAGDVHQLHPMIDKSQDKIATARTGVSNMQVSTLLHSRNNACGKNPAHRFFRGIVLITVIMVLCTLNSGLGLSP